MMHTMVCNGALGTLGAQVPWCAMRSIAPITMLCAFYTSSRLQLSSQHNSQNCLLAAGPIYFEYIGTGDTCSYYDSSLCPAISAATVAQGSSCNDAITDTVNMASTIKQIPVPASAPLYLIAFVLSDNGQSLGDFQPMGSLQAANGMWDPSQISALRSLTGKVCCCFCRVLAIKTAINECFPHLVQIGVF